MGGVTENTKCLMSNYDPSNLGESPFLPLDQITVSPSELLQINLKERISVIP